jgi:general secretion pathway protein G
VISALSRRSEKGSRSVAAGASEGFTLVEMLVVLTIISLIIGLVGPRVLNYLSMSRVKSAKIQIESFGSALDLFYIDEGRYPTNSEGLSALVERPGGVEIWNGPYVKGGRIPTDPWGHAYQYHIAADHNPPYEIISLGPDGRGVDGNGVQDASNVVR